MHQPLTSAMASPVSCFQPSDTSTTPSAGLLPTLESLFTNIQGHHTLPHDLSTTSLSITWTPYRRGPENKAVLYCAWPPWCLPSVPCRAVYATLPTLTPPLSPLLHPFLSPLQYPLLLPNPHLLLEFHGVWGLCQRGRSCLPIPLPTPQAGGG